LTWKRIDSAYEWLIFFKSIQRHGMINNGNRFEFGDKRIVKTFTSIFVKLLYSLNSTIYFKGHFLICPMRFE